MNYDSYWSVSFRTRRSPRHRIPFLDCTNVARNLPVNINDDNTIFIVVVACPIFANSFPSQSIRNSGHDVQDNRRRRDFGHPFHGHHPPHEYRFSLRVAPCESVLFGCSWRTDDHIHCPQVSNKIHLFGPTVSAAGTARTIAAIGTARAIAAIRAALAAGTA